MKLVNLVLVLGITGLVGACTDEDISYANRPFNPPADSQNGFLGYYTTADQQTTCGNCHADYQRDWRATGHSGAWAGLQESGAAEESCEGCHSVSERGNGTGAPAGYTATQAPGYRDVQCESCHGPGFEHVSGPGVTDFPLAKIAAELDDTAGTCGDCHSDSHHPFVEEWAQSRHAEALATPATRADCNYCHEARAVLKAWNVQSHYVESGDVVTAANAIGITCAVCHDPHGSPNPANLRWPLETLDPSQNLCMRCHLRRTEPEGGSSRGNTPHAPQGAVLLGEAGYQNSNYLDTVLLSNARTTSHAALTRNPRLCAGCHVYQFETTDDAGNAFQVSGHLFRPLPCYGPDGLPTDSIVDCAYTPVARSFRACTVSGCHIDEDQAADLVAVSRTRMRTLSATLWVDTNGDRVIDAYPTDDGYLAHIKANTTDLDPADAIISAADGAEFNVRLVGEDANGFLYDNADKSHAVHNPFIAEALLLASTRELADLYGGQPWFPAPPSPTDGAASRAASLR